MSSSIGQQCKGDIRWVFQWAIPAEMLLLGTLAFAQTTSGVGTQGTSPQEGGLWLKEDCVPKERLIRAFEVHIAGSFEGVTNIPSGWFLQIANGSNLQSTLEAHAGSGVALYRQAILNIGIQVLRTPTADERMQVWGWLTVVNADGKESRLPLSMYSFDFEEAYLRHRIR